MLRLNTLLLAAALALSAPAAAQPGPRPAVGAVVRDASGQVLGKIESVTFDNAGRPAQVVVRTRGIAGVRAQSRAVPIASLRRERDGWTVPLRRREFELLPSVKR